MSCAPPELQLWNLPPALRALIEETVGLDSTDESTPPLSFREFIQQVRPGYRWYRHCEVLVSVLQRVADGKIKRLLVFMPPRHSKSETVSRLFSAYWLYRFPHQWVGINCYGADLAYTLARAAQENYVRAGGLLKPTSRAVRHYETPAGGGMWAAGVGGPIGGKGWHLGLIDDPIKNADESMSETIREKHKEWYESTFYTREEPNSDGDHDGALVIVQTRWHEDDLSGWLLAQEISEDDPEDAERWHIVCFEAIKEEESQTFPPTCTVEPDWRQPGEALCPERRPISKLQRIRRRVLEYFFSALFQQRPSPKQGTMFDPAWFPIVEAVPAEVTRIRYWDKAGTAGGSGARTSGVLMARDRLGLYTIEDVVVGRWAAGDREAAIRQAAELDGRRVAIVVEQEPGSGGKESAEATIRSLAGWVVSADRVTGDKVLRAEPLAAQARVGNIRLLRGTWNREFLEELRAFPRGKLKDQVDAASGAFNRLADTSKVVPRAVFGRSPIAGYRG